MDVNDRPLIEFDLAAYAPQRVMAATHRLSEHPLLRLENLVELARRLAPKNSLRWHSDEAQPQSSFHHAPQQLPTQWDAVTSLERIGEARAWVSLLNIQQDAVYRELVDLVLDDVRERIEPFDPGMSFRAGWIFVASPGAVTPFHIDHEHNFILQISGAKTLYVWDPLDRMVLSEAALDLFHAKYSRELVEWREGFDERAHKFELVPGMGGYMPSTAPHWVRNGPQTSITLSTTFYTDLTRRQKLLHRANHLLRRLGLEPTMVGANSARDRHVLRGFEMLRRGSHLAQLVRGRAPEDLRVRYAPVG